MADAPIDMWEMQLAFAIGLLGIYAGWRGTIAKMTGFYDLSGAVKTLLFGILAGVLAASAIDNMILVNIRSSSQNILALSAVAIVIALAESSFALLVLGRSRTVGLRASAPYGWTLGLGFGAMRSSHLNVRLFDDSTWGGVTGFEFQNILLAFIITITTCIGHASIATWQGSKIVENVRIRTLPTSTVLRATLMMASVMAIFYPPTIALILPIVVWSWFPAHESWLPSGLTPAAKQAFRRTIRQSENIKSMSESRIRGKLLESEE